SAGCERRRLQSQQVLCVSAFLWLPLARAEPIRYSVAEEAESGSVVGELAEDAGLTPAQLSARRARLVSEDGRQHFRLERASGRLVVAGRLDREELCAQSATCMLPFELLLSNPLQFFRVEVNLEDKNDNSPVFTEEQVTFKIVEKSEPGSRFPLEVAHDLDIGNNTVQEYNISPENEYFSVSYGARSTGDKYLELVLEKPLDREQEAEMGFHVIAVDGGSPPRSGAIEISIIILDVNDNAPVFMQERYVMKVLENLPEGSVVLTVQATDQDEGVNGDISYQLSQVVGQSDSAFVIDPRTGEIKLTKPLDYEAAQMHEFSVRATDGGGLSAICKVLVEVVDVNDNAPELVVSSFSSPLPENTVPSTVVEQAEMSFSLIAVDGGSPPRRGTTEVKIVILDVNDNAPIFTQDEYIGQVSENMPEGSVVLTVQATDPDAGINGDISYQLSQAVGKSDSAFVIDNKTGEIKITKPLDYEAAHMHDVRATDGGGLSAICKVLVEVVDVNDNAPELVVSSFSSPLPENTVPGTVVALFTVRDRDSGANGKITCALEDQLFFSLRPAYKNYYELVTVSALDREETPQYVLRVTAADAGSPPLTSTHTFTVDISDVNDNAPVFNQTSYTMYVRENNVGTVFVGAVSAADADVGLNAKVSYSLAPEQGPERARCSCISVNSENGHVFVLRPLDYEHLRQSEVTVSASDAGSPPLRANVTVRLVVLDENDNAPLVLYPAQESSPASSELVPVSAEAGYLISKVVAVDADSGQNAWLSYHLLRATDPGLFSVGLQSGEVRLRRPVTERDSVKQKLLVLVRDNGQPPLSATAALSALLLKDFSDVRLPHASPPTEDQDASLTTYLILALVFVSLLFLISTAVLLARKVCRRKELKAGHVLYAADTLQSGLADAAAAGTLPAPTCYEISLTTGSGNSEFRFLKPILPSLPPQHCTVGQGLDEEQDFPAVPVSTEDMAPDSAGTLSAGQFNALSFN
uniref:Protocadherin beta 3 n=1 Tax=Serinus canaria TaxID=9135 RepID=A0A8C9N1G9_SERCA